MADELSASMLEFFTWVAARCRTYDEASEAWRSTCPRHSVWEDAFIVGLVRLETCEDTRKCLVLLTRRGDAAFDPASGQPHEQRHANAA